MFCIFGHVAPQIPGVFNLATRDHLRLDVFLKLDKNVGDSTLTKKGGI